MVYKLTSYIISAFALFVHLHLLNTRRRFSLWMNEKIKIFIKERNKLQKIAKRNGNRVDKSKYKKIGNLVKTKIRDSYYIIYNSFDENKLYFNYISLETLLESIKQITTNAMGPDNINIKMIQLSLLI